MKKIKYYVRTTGERQLDSSYSQIEYELLIDTEHNARKSFVEQLEKLAKTEDHVIILEDDLILCKDFKKKMEEALKGHKSDVVNFFYSPMYWFESRYTNYFCWNQCVFYPNAVLKKLSKKMRELYEKSPNKPHDEVESDALLMLGIKTWLHRPCLVQHKDEDTLIQTRTSGRRTPYFEDYLEELGIRYERALKNRERLMRLMRNKFRKKDQH